MRESVLSLRFMRYTLVVSVRVLGVLGGNDVDDGRLVAWCSSATHIYAADSGADRIIALGFEPVVVGDFDSFTSLPSSANLRLVQSLDQDTTDCDKLLALVQTDGHDEITMAATEGDLPDHVLATFSSAVASSLRVRFAFRRGCGILVRPGENGTAQTSVGQRVSLIPLTPCHGVSMSGVRWPLSGATIATGERVSVSNEATAESVSVSIVEGAAMLFFETQEIVW